MLPSVKWGFQGSLPHGAFVEIKQVNICHTFIMGPGTWQVLDKRQTLLSLIIPYLTDVGLLIFFFYFFLGGIIN